MSDDQRDGDTQVTVSDDDLRSVLSAASGWPRDHAATERIKAALEAL